MSPQKLRVYNNAWFDRGRPAWVEALWMVVSVVFSSSLPGSGWRVFLLRQFGAGIAGGVVIKPGVRIKFPWKLTIEADVWIGERCWLDNLGQVSIGHDSCISQGVYICTGNHDWSSESFDLVVQPVVLEPGCWIGAYARLAPGVTVHQNAVIAMGAILMQEADPDTVYAGNPAVPVRKRWQQAEDDQDRPG